MNLLWYDPSIFIEVDPEEGITETLEIREAIVCVLRRHLTSLARSVLNFEGIEAFPDGPKSKTRKFRKDLEFVRKKGLALDGEFVTSNPEVLTGFRPITCMERRSGGGAEVRIMVALHLHYTELWEEIELLLRRWPVPFSLYVTLTTENKELSAKIYLAFPSAKVLVVENRGRDVRPFLCMLENGSFDGYDIVCKIHGKRSLGNGRSPIIGNVMRRAAFLDLIGSGLQVKRIIRRFSERPSLGLVGSARLLSASTSLAQRDVIGPANRVAVEALARQLGAPLRDRGFDFFEGTMFWVRPEALGPLRRLALSANGFAPEIGLTDGALEHAVERLFNLSARVAGFQVEGVSIQRESYCESESWK